jgi:hypothetical protein
MVWDRLEEKVGFVTQRSTSLPLGPCWLRGFNVPDNVPIIHAFVKDLSHVGTTALQENLEKMILGDDARSEQVRNALINDIRGAQYCLISIHQSQIDADLLQRLAIKPSDSIEKTLKQFYFADFSNNIRDVSTKFLGIEPSQDAIMAVMHAMHQELDWIHRMMDEFINQERNGENDV